MKELKNWIQENFDESEQSSIELDVQKEILAIESAKQLSKNFIRSLMEERNIGFNEFSKRTKISPSHLQAILSGKSSPTLSTMAKIAGIFGKTLEVRTL
jgi:predicted transcriptional regulator